MTPTREVFWNISHIWVMYALLVPTLAIAAYGVWRHVRQWRKGQPALRFDRPMERFGRVFKLAVLQLSLWRDNVAGVMHAMLFWGFLTLLAATTVVFVHEDLNIRIMQGDFYLYFQSLFVNIIGALAMVGVGIGCVRRWIVRPKKLVFSDEASWILITIFVILGSGFLLEGWRIAATDDQWASWSPIGNAVAVASLSVASKESLQTAHLIFWWGHLAIVFGFLAWAPYTKMLHALTAPLNIFFGNLDANAGSLKTMDFETATTFGINSLEQFTWKDLMDLDCVYRVRALHECLPSTHGGQTTFATRHHS